MADKDTKTGSVTGAADLGEAASDRAEAQQAYTEAVREANGSNDPEKALQVGRAAARAYARTMKWLAGS